MAEQTVFDFAYLESFAADDMQVVAEVLNLFIGQAEGWRPRLLKPDDGWRDLVHTIKGSSRGIGAAALGDVAERAEPDPSKAGEVLAALDEAVAEVEGYLTRIGGG